MKEAESVMSAMADAFADIEKKARTVHEVVVGQKVLKAIKASGNFEPKHRTFWGARVRLDCRVKGLRVVLRSRAEPKIEPKLGRVSEKKVTLQVQGVG